ncbi:MAG: DUF1846 family protein [Candidatus Gracilibacteria bacterium]|nr:DUF1846 family protein [Candidatus Gracilibacteria bacterium]
MKTSDIIKYEKLGFDGQKYIDKQTNAILDRISKFKNRLYLEIGGKFLYDSHASRVLPGFFVDSKKRIFSKLKDNADIIFCINARDLEKNRQLSSDSISYGDYCLKMVNDIENEIGIKAKISINRVKIDNKNEVETYRESLQKLGFEVYFRYEILGYPKDTKKVLSKNGYGSDEYIRVEKNLVLVTGAASSSGKMSTCLGQIYHEETNSHDSGYAKYETFPIWNLPLDHPVNLAYEAATADIGDYNMMDIYHEKAYSMSSVNYNRDVEAFEIVSGLASDFLPIDNYTRSYKSPTDMGINTAGFCIVDDEIVQKASIEEIDRRYNWYKEIIERGDGDKIWLQRCDKLKERL